MAATALSIFRVTVLRGINVHTAYIAARWESEAVFLSGFGNRAKAKMLRKTNTKDRVVEAGWVTFKNPEKGVDGGMKTAATVTAAA